jgi:uncharacterized membrane protein YdjX (TVP38/TMEM64 family)
MAGHDGSHIWLWGGLAALLAAACLGWFLLPVDDWLNAFRRWIGGLGPWGVAAFAVVYVAAALLLVPEAPLTIAAGVAYGAWAFPLVYAAAIVGAALAFLVARHAARAPVQAFVARRPKLRAVDQAVSEDGWKIVALLRLSPLVPFNLQNYFFGITDIPFAPYLAATSGGIVPGTALYVYVGVLGKAMSGGAEPGGEALKWAFFGAGLLATLVVAVLVARKANAKLKQIGIGDE